MKKYLFLIATAVAALAIVSCKKDDTKKVDPTGGVDVATANLVAYFPLNSATDAVKLGEGVTFDKIAGKAKFGVGVRGGCYESTGTVEEEAYLKLNVPATFTSSLSSFTLSAWVYQTGHRGGVFSVGSTDEGVDPNWGAMSMFLDGGNADDGTMLKYYYNNTNPNAKWHGFFPGYKGQEVALNTWFFATLTYNENTSKQAIYVNGVQVFEGDVLLEGGGAGAGKISLFNASSCYVGAHAQRVSGASAETWLSYLAGKVDEVRLFNKGLSANEVQALYRAEVAAADGLD